MNYKRLSSILIVLNLIFICAAAWLGYRYYPNIKAKVFPDLLAAIQESPLSSTASPPKVFHDASAYKIIGQLPHTETYTRLPPHAQQRVQPAIWELGQYSAGVSIRFSSNSSAIDLRWELQNNTNVSNMTPVAAKGLDLYAYVDRAWQFVGAAEPGGGYQNEATLISGMDTLTREYLLNLPLYDGIRSLEIGIDAGAFIRVPSQAILDTARPIIFYGTSITQGASVSRPGLMYTALLARYFNREVLNLGFSGNGRFKKEIAEYIMTANPSVVVLDCTPNSSPATIHRNLPQTIDCLLSVNDSVSILLVESIMRDFSFFKKDDPAVWGTRSYIEAQNGALQAVYDQVKGRGNIHYIGSDSLIGTDHEATIDGTHFNDLGHHRAYRFLRKEMERILSP